MTGGRASPAPRSGAGSGAHVALVTCADLPALDEDDQLLADVLAARGATVAPVVWDDSRVDWRADRLAVLRSTWDYTGRREEFLRWADGVPRLRNPAPLVRWNTDKRYLADLAAAGVPTVPTTWVAPDDERPPVEWLPSGDTWVVKPSVGAGSRDCARYSCAEAAQREAAAAHVARLRRAGYRVMLQPYLPAVDTDGETALIFFADPETGALSFSHAVRKGPMLPPAGAGAGTPSSDGPPLYVPERIMARTPTEQERAVAWAALEALGTAAPAVGALPLYARVDLLPGPDGAPLLVELELTEPSLFLAHAPSSADRFAEAVLAAANSSAATGSSAAGAGGELG